MQRLDRIDALRGLAVVWMTAFHFSFDLSHAGLWPQNFYTDPFWTWQRVAIVSVFLFCVGLGQAVAEQHAVTWPRFWRRWIQVAGGALLVSAGSAFMFPSSGSKTVRNSILSFMIRRSILSISVMTVFGL